MNLHRLVKIFAITAVLSATGASASVIPVLLSVTPSGSDFVFTYRGTIAGDQGLKFGSKLIIFDFAGYIAGSIFTGNADVVGTTELTSTLPILFPATDDPTIPNLVFTYIGPDFQTTGGPYPEFSFTGLGAMSKYGGLAIDGFSAEAVTNIGLAAGLPAHNQGFVIVPKVPEPATWLTMIVGLAAVGIARRRRGSMMHALQ
jgi:hypothetical protein